MLDFSRELLRYACKSDQTLATGRDLVRDINSIDQEAREGLLTLAVDVHDKAARAIGTITEDSSSKKLELELELHMMIAGASMFINWLQEVQEC